LIPFFECFQNKVTRTFVHDPHLEKKIRGDNPDGLSPLIVILYLTKKIKPQRQPRKEPQQKLLCAI